MKKRCFQKCHWGKTSPGSLINTRQARSPLLGRFCLSSATLTSAEPRFGLVWDPTWCMVLPGVFAARFVQHILTTLILTPLFLITLCPSRSSSSTVPLSMVEQHIYYVTCQQVDCFFPPFLSSWLCLASPLHRAESRQEIILRFWWQFFLDGVCRTTVWSQRYHKYCA